MSQDMKSINLPCTITIYPEQDRAIDRVLSDLLERCPAQIAIIAETSGQFISSAGERGGIDLVALGSLIAGDLAASQEIARKTGQYQKCQLVLRQGEKAHTFITECGEYLILFVQVSHDVPLGWARLLITEASRQVAEIVAATPKDVEKLELGLDKNDLDHWADETLNSLWTS